MKPKILNETESLCPVCLKRIDAGVIIRDNKVLLSKSCPEHGKFECFHAWDDPFLYKELIKLSKKQKVFAKDIMLNTTSKCNLQCPFCFSTMKQNHYEPKIQDLIEKAKSWGEGNVLLYGGEPTLREDLFEIIKQIKKLGFGIHLLTNGLKLDQEFVMKLEETGLDNVELQLDSLDDKINLKIRNRKLLKHKLSAIKNLRNSNISLNFNIVLAQGVHRSQINQLITYSAKNSDKIITINFSPISPEEPNDVDIKYISNDEIFQTFEKEFGITKEDFITCTGFDVALSNFLYKKWKIKRLNTVPCLVSCHVFVSNSKVIPFNRLVELNKISEIFDEVIESKSNSKLKILSNVFYKFIKTKVRIRPVAIPILLKFFKNLLLQYIRKKDIKNNFKNLFGIAVRGSYQTRYNIDYNFVKKCNTYIDNKDGGFSTFCENNIFFIGPKRLKSLNFDWILNHKKS